MRNLLFLLLFTVSSQAYAQVVNTKNWTLIHERTASWCPNCGTWGWNMKDQIFNKFANENVIFMAVHYSGDLLNPVAQEFDANFGGFGQPIFFVDGININANSTNISQKLNETQLEVDFKKDAVSFAGVGLKATLDESTKTLTADAKIEFLSNVEGGDYYFGMYLLEDVQNVQASRTGIQTHKNVLRHSVLKNVFNNPLHQGDISSGTTFTMSGSISDLPSKADKYKLIGVIWTKVNGKYLFFNANMIPVSGVSSSQDINDSFDFNAYQAESGNIIVQTPQGSDLAGASISVTDISGKTLSTVQINGNDHNRVSIEGAFLPGIHVVTISKGSKLVSKKISLL